LVGRHEIGFSTKAFALVAFSSASWKSQANYETDNILFHVEIRHLWRLSVIAATPTPAIKSKQHNGMKEVPRGSFRGTKS